MRFAVSIVALLSCIGIVTGDVRADLVPACTAAPQHVCLKLAFKRLNDTASAAVCCAACVADDNTPCNAWHYRPATDACYLHKSFVPNGGTNCLAASVRHPTPGPSPSGVCKGAGPPLKSLHAFSDCGVGDVDGVFELNGTYHLFSSELGWFHKAGPSAIGPWHSVGASINSGKRRFVSGSTTVVNGEPRIVAPLGVGIRPNASCTPAKGKPPCEQPCCPADGSWGFPCWGFPPTATCNQPYVMSRPLHAATDPDLTEWETGAEQTVIVPGNGGAPGHGHLQQDPTMAWLDPREEHRGRWLFAGATRVNGSEVRPMGVNALELFASRAGDDWIGGGFEYLGILASTGAAGCDPNLIPLSSPAFANGSFVAVYGCSSDYMVGRIAATPDSYRLEPLPGIEWPRLAWVNARASRGFVDSRGDENRYLIWSGLNRKMKPRSPAQAFSITREVGFDADLSVLLTQPAREYRKLLRRQKLANVTEGDMSTVAAAMDKVCPQAHTETVLDIELAFSWAGKQGTADAASGPGGFPFGMTVPQFGISVYVCVEESGTDAVLVVSDAKPACPPPTDPGAGRNQYLHTAAMPFSLKKNEQSVALRIVQEGSIVEAFAQSGRANVALWPQGDVHGSSTASRTPGLPSSSCAELVASSAMEGWTAEFGAWDLAFGADVLAVS